MLPFLPWLIAAVALAGSLSLMGWMLWQGRRRTGEPPPLPAEWDVSPRPVFTADERRVYRQLREALPHHIVLAKLPLVRLCQPNDPKTVRYWFGLLGAVNVTYAVCSANGRVLAAIDLSYDNGGPPSRATRIKTAVLGTCRVRYLRCPADHLPSIPELQLLVPHGTGAARGPNPAPDHVQPEAASRNPAPGHSARRRVRSTLWQDSTAFSDSFFQHEPRAEATGVTGSGDLRPLPGLPPDTGNEPVGLAPATGFPAEPTPPLHH